MEKCEFFLSKIKYLGQVIDEKGSTPDPNRADAIKYMPAPTYVAALQSFLVLANYYNSDIPNIHILRAPLNQLLKKDVKWNWTDESALTSNLALTHYNLNKQIYVASDARNSGLGSVILHKEDGKTDSTCIKDATTSRYELFADRKGRFSYRISDQEISLIRTR